MFWGGLEPMLPRVGVEDQADALVELLDVLDIKKPVNLIGLSYGGGITLQFAAHHPDRIDQAVALAPYVAPLAAQDELVNYIKDRIQQYFPAIPYSEEEIYDYVLRGLVYSTYQISEPSIRKWGFVQQMAASELIRGIRHMDYHDLIADLEHNSMHLVMAGHDAYVEEDQLREFWAAIPEEGKGSLLYIDGIEHKINESVGPFVADWALKLAKKGRATKGGAEYVGYPEQGIAKGFNGKRDIKLIKTKICEHHLLRPAYPGAPNLPIDRIDRGDDYWRKWRPWLMGPMHVWYDKLLNFFRGM
jgi:pimeloyl-ACP methyl ester carboxylesterase